VIDFLKYRWLSAIFSAAIFIAFFGGIIYKRATRGEAFVYSVDFTGGTQVLFSFSNPIETQKVAEVLEEHGWQGATIREFSSTELLVRVKYFESDAKGLAERIKLALEEKMPGASVQILQVDSVGAGVGETLRFKSTLAIIVALLLMLLYIWARFRSFAFAIGNIVSLVHDAVVILTFVLWFDYEISLHIISAVLFILGYSINDTIVIFSRIREEMHKHSNYALETIVNRSITETLRRTILTSFATALVVVALLLFGGEILRTFALALFIGIVFGTYSSIYIASPAMLMFQKRRA
jgi:preprotein translocase subunit SecF